MSYIYLMIAIITEVTATLLLKMSDGVEKWWFALAAVIFYAIAGLCLSIVLKTMNVGIVYSIWSGAGIALVCIASVLIWQQKLDIYAICGIALILSGTLLITAKSNVAL